MLLISGGVVVPIILLTAIAASLGGSALPISVFVQLFGFACLVFAKWPQLAGGELFLFGPARLCPRGRKFYWFGYALIACGLVLACASFAYAA